MVFIFFLSFQDCQQRHSKFSRDLDLPRLISWSSWPAWFELPMCWTSKFDQMDGFFFMESPTKMDDLGIPLWLRQPSTNSHVKKILYHGWNVKNHWVISSGQGGMLIKSVPAAIHCSNLPGTMPGEQAAGVSTQWASGASSGMFMDSRINSLVYFDLINFDSRLI